MKSIKFWLGIVVSIGLVWWAFSRVDISQLGQALSRTNYWWLAACLPLFYLQFAIRALRWDYLLRPIKKIPYASLIASTVIGFTGNMVLPARLGEVIRALDLSRREKIPFPSSAATIFLERVFDGLIIVPMFLISGWLLGIFNADTELAQVSRAAASIFAGVYIIALAAVVLVSALPQRVEALTALICKPLPDKLGGLICRVQISLAEGLMMLRRPKLLLISTLYSIGLWMMLALPIYFLALGVGFKISILAAIFVQGAICLAVAVPSSPGFVGTMHAAAQISLVTATGMAAEQALALALIYHGANFVFLILYCLKFLIKGDVSLLDLNRAALSKDKA